MKEYHKISTVYKRNPETKFRTLMEGEYAEPEFKYLKDNKWIFTEKIDGTNIRIMCEDGVLKFGGKTDNAQIPTFLLKKLQELFPIDLLSEVFPGGPDEQVCMYGEGYGAKIQKGGGNYIPDGCNIILFDVKVDEWWLQRHNVENISNKFGIPTVPIIGEGTLSQGIQMVKDGFDSVIGKCKAEGLVMRPEVDLFNRSGKRVITKIKHKDFNK